MSITKAERKRRCDYCEQRRATETIDNYRYCGKCANAIIRQANSSARRLTAAGHFHD
jgi:Zn finger protein HypA/HybF involved in hydrogenase expression